MDKTLFSTNLSIDDKNMVYQVVQEGDKYTFVSEANNAEFPAFSLSRQGDRWNEHELISPDLKKQAVVALDKYLLQDNRA